MYCGYIKSCGHDLVAIKTGKGITLLVNSVQSQFSLFQLIFSSAGNEGQRQITEGSFPNAIF